MDNIIPFPIQDDKSRQKTLAHIRQTYIDAGLSESSAEAALEEFKPILEQFTKGRKEYEMEIPASCSLTNEQIEIIRNAHTECVQQVFTDHYEKLGLLLNIIAGLIGSSYIT